MIKHAIQATVFYQHYEYETAELAAAARLMSDHIKAVANGYDRAKIKAILGGEYFRVHDADRMRCLLLRASRHARAHLVDYFPDWRPDIMTNAERLEEAVEKYWREFSNHVDEVMPRR